MEEFFEYFIPNVVPLTFYLESVATIIVNQGVEGIQSPPATVIVLYYLNIAAIYGGLIIRVVLMYSLKGYSRGYWIHILIVVQFTLQLMLVLASIFNQNTLKGFYWILWKLIIFILAWGSVIIMRLGFIILVSFKILNKGSQHMKIKEAYWLSLTTKEQLREYNGRLCYEPQAVPQTQRALQ